MRDVQQYQVPRNIISGISITFLLILGAVTAWLVPLPVLYYRIKLGRRIGMIIPAVMIVILVWLSKATLTLDLIIVSGWILLGLLISECFERKLTIEKTILYSSLAVLIPAALVMLFYSSISQTGIYDLVFTEIKAALTLFKNEGANVDLSDEVLHSTIRLLPGMTAASVVFFSWANIMFAVPLLKKKNLPAPDFGKLDEWKSPEKFVWVAIFVTVVLLTGYEPLTLLCSNVMWFVVLVYCFQGISIVSFLVKKTQTPPFLRYLLYWLVFFQFPFNLVIPVIGLFDLWVDFRKLISRVVDKKNNE